MTTDTDVGVATPVTAAGGLVAAAELAPPQADNSSAATAVRNAQVMVFTRRPPDARQVTCRPAAKQKAKRRSVRPLAMSLERPTAQLSKLAGLIYEITVTGLTKRATVQRRDHRGRIDLACRGYSRAQIGYGAREPRAMCFFGGHAPS